jgi:LacI family transcriptional regulator
MENEMKKRTTITDVARAAQVSLMTVSRVMNGKPGVSEELRQRILALADEMDYRPSQIARGLATRHTATIGLLVPDIANPFFAQMVRGVEDVAFERGYTIFLINTGEHYERELAAFDSLWQKEIDGVIVCSSRLPIAELESAIQRFPAVVLFNRELATPMDHVTMININDQLGAELAVEHLLGIGRTRIGLVAGPATSVSAQRRLDGYRAALNAAKIVFDPALIEYCAPFTDDGRVATHTLLSRRPKADAILAFNDLVAVGVMQACQEAGRRVPEDIAVIGCDDIPLATIIRPRLTTVHVDLNAIGRMLMDSILTLIECEGDDDPRVRTIDPSLVIRESA